MPTFVASPAALAALLGTRAFQQAALIVAALLVIGGIVMWLSFARTSELLSRQTIETISLEASAIASIAEGAGPAAAVEAVSRRAGDGAGRLYLIESAVGTRLAGNLARWPAGMPRTTTATGATFEYHDVDGGTRLAAGIARRIGPDLALLVGRDLQTQRSLANEMRWLYLAGFGTLALAGLLAGLLASRLSLGRVAEIASTSDQIMAGDFSRRVRVSGSGDELDRLAGNLNAMLDRIESLMAGLREVSDNIAHDLKTPLTRLRARAETSLREENGAAAREGLGRVIEDADELIKTFNAMLLIARLEAGAVEGSFETLDVTALVHDVAELYEPVAEEAGMRLVCQPSDGVMLRANRQLIGQALANMIDNAIKYGRRSEARTPGANHGDADIVVMLTAEAGVVRISTADHGPGIPARDRDRVLKRFVRLEESRTKPGTGLGLSLVAAVARLHGGRIGLEDNAPGLKIVLELPFISGSRE